MASVRQSLIDNIVETMRQVTRSAEDATPDLGDYAKHVDHTWVFEGKEDPNLDTTGLTTCHLEVVTQSTFSISSVNELNRKGRELLAVAQRAMMEDLRRGGWATRTTEAGNVIGSETGEAKRPVGILTAWWDVQYDRDRIDPDSKG